MLNREGTAYLYRASPFNNLRMDEELAQVNIPFYFGNQEFFQNLIDYMMGEESVITLRSRQIDVYALDRTKVAEFALYYQIINIAIPTLLIALMAFLMAYFRKRKYAR